MKKVLLTILFTIILTSIKGEIYFFPGPIGNYSAKIIISLENYNKATGYENFNKNKNTTNYWGGLGVTGSLFGQYEKPLLGLETGVERRHYFKDEQFKHFFISAYIGVGYMTDFKYFSGIGLAPGFKIGYKANLKASYVLEPCISLSVPIMHELRKDEESAAIPALTFGLRFGFNKIKTRT